MNCGTPCLSCFTHQIPCHKKSMGLMKHHEKPTFLPESFLGQMILEKLSESTSHGSFLTHQDGHQYDSHCGTTSTF